MEIPNVPSLGLRHLYTALPHKLSRIFQNNREPCRRVLCLRRQKLFVLFWTRYDRFSCNEPLDAKIVAHGIQVFDVVVLETTEEKMI